MKDEQEVCPANACRYHELNQANGSLATVSLAAFNKMAEAEAALEKVSNMARRVDGGPPTVTGSEVAYELRQIAQGLQPTKEMITEFSNSDPDLDELREMCIDWVELFLKALVPQDPLDGNYDLDVPVRNIKRYQPLYYRELLQVNENSSMSDRNKAITSAQYNLELAQKDLDRLSDMPAMGIDWGSEESKSGYWCAYCDKPISTEEDIPPKCPDCGRTEAPSANSD